MMKVNDGDFKLAMEKILSAAAQWFATAMMDSGETVMKKPVQ